MGEAAFYTKHKEDLERSFFKAIPGKLSYFKDSYLIGDFSLVNQNIY